MIHIPALPQLSPPASSSAVKRLTELRRELETTGKWPELEIPAVLLLIDICQAPGLSEADRQVVLGARGVAYFEAVATTPMHLVQ